MPVPRAVADALARAHHAPLDGLPVGPLLLDVADSSRTGDWSLRSALVRFAQPEPTRAGAVLELVRRTDGALKPHRRHLEATVVPAHPALRPDGDLGPATRTDSRAADLGRVLVRLTDGAEVLDAYAEVEGLDPGEVTAAHLCAVAVELDDLADVLVGWAVDHDGPPPVDAVERLGARAHARLEALGVPRESGPPPGARRRG